MLYSWLFFILAKTQIVSVTDGDSFRLRTEEGFELKARLVGVDCPEKGGRKSKKPQPGAREAHQRLQDLLKGEVQVLPIGTDHFGRSLVEVRTADGKLINELLIEEGTCEAFRGKIQKDADLYRKAEERAKKEKKGIWSMKNYESPHLFRKRQMR